MEPNVDLKIKQIKNVDVNRNKKYKVQSNKPSHKCRTPLWGKLQNFIKDKRKPK